MVGFEKLQPHKISDDVKMVYKLRRGVEIFLWFKILLVIAVFCFVV